MTIVICTLLIIAANGAPVLAAYICKSRWAWPLDGGHRFIDGKPWLGAAKTWRGIIVAVAATALAAQWLNIGWQLGTAMGALAMLGDLFSSFIKRRANIKVSGRAWLLDQVPESLLPMIILWKPLGLDSMTEAGIVVVVFTVLNLALSPLLYRFRIWKRP